MILAELFQDAVTAVCCGDLIMSLYQQVKPCEKEKGAADAVRRLLEQEYAGQIRTHRLKPRRRRKVYRDIIRAFDQIPVQDAVFWQKAIACELLEAITPYQTLCDETYRQWRYIAGRAYEDGEYCYEKDRAAQHEVFLHAERAAA